MAQPSYEMQYVTKSANYTLLQNSDDIVFATAALTFTLPASSTCYPGQQFTIFNNISGGGVVTIAPNGTDTINGVNANDTSLVTRYSSMTLKTDGAGKWFKVALSLGGQLAGAAYATKATSYTIVAETDRFLKATAALTFTLPSAAACSPGQTFVLMNDISGGGVVTIAPAGTDNINGANANDTSMVSRYSQLTLMTDGSANWWKIGQQRGAGPQAYATKATGYTVNPASDAVLRASAALTFTLPSAALCSPGQQFTFINDSSGTVTVAPNGTDTINGVNANDTTLTAQYFVATYMTDGVSRWWKPTAGPNVAPQTMVISVVTGAGTASQPLYTFPNDSTTWQVAAASARFTTASSSGTLQIEIAGAAVAVGSGTVQLTGTVSLAGTANTAVNGTVIASPTTSAAGNSLNAVFGGTMTSIAGLAITVVLKRIT